MIISKYSDSGMKTETDNEKLIYYFQNNVYLFFDNSMLIISLHFENYKLIFHFGNKNIYFNDQSWFALSGSLSRI